MISFITRMRMGSCPILLIISSFSCPNFVRPGVPAGALLLGLLLQYLFPCGGLAAGAVIFRSGAEELYGERGSLVQLREILSSSSSTSNGSINLHGNWTGPPCHKNQSRWAGIGCSNSHVTHLVLEGLQLNASLPPKLLQNVTFLTKLSFRNNSLYGPLPDVTNLRNLQFLFLSDNKFSGSIPASYAQLPKLAKLELQQNSLGGTIPPFDQNTLSAFNVSHNQLTGPIPETATLLSFSEDSYDFNSNLCGRPLRVQCPSSPPPLPPPPTNGTAPVNPPEKKKGHLKTWMIFLIAVVAGLVLPLSVMIWFLWSYRRIGLTTKSGGETFTDITQNRQHWSESTNDPGRRNELEFFDKSRPVFYLDDLLKASAEVIGKGELGTTYKATLEDGLAVAVKRLKDMNDVSGKEFNQQMKSLGKLKHQNLVEIISCYCSKDEKLIIYEHVSHGSLFQLLHENRGIGRQPMNWRARLSIVKGISRALHYLHQSLPSHKVPHGNLKSSNVLISIQDGDTYQSKLTDFGLYPLLRSRKSSHQKLAVEKYAPEFLQRKRLTAKSDVYCLGILILEIITGKTPGNGLGRGGGGGGGGGEGSKKHQGLGEQEAEYQYDYKVDDLSDWVRAVVNSDWSTDILDVEILAEKEGYNEMLELTNIALDCTAIAPENRPNMTQVLTRIEEMDVSP